MSGLIHPTALVATSARIDPTSRIGPWALIEEDVEVGPGCIIEAHAVIRGGTRMGRGNRIFEGAVLGGEPQDLKFEGARSGVRIGDDNVIREHVTVHRSTSAGGVTVLGSRNYLMVNAHVAHDCRLGDGAILANNVALAGHVSIGDAAFLSGGVVVHQFCRIGRLAMLGGNAKVIQDVPPFLLADGIPARLRSLNLVGLRRAGIDPDGLRGLKQAWRILGSTAALEPRLVRLAGLECRWVAELMVFLRDSGRGVASPARPAAGQG